MNLTECRGLENGSVKQALNSVFVKLSGFKVTSPNKPEHYMARYGRSVKEKLVVGMELMAHGVRRKVTFPVKIILTRYSARPYDHDNYVAGCKYIRDAIADYLIPGLAPGRADDSPQITWEYRQEFVSKKNYLTIEFTD